ncbi:transcriptional regulator [Burkholderia phage BcepSauron]|uniref:Transcriptional regulator n=1 Tax=Burkholderia phage BcepSauron TaxID=2530033 RepID=A0A482MKS7_9CAUD|nr:transcriptional regulator [Burkholderia phage BcepSauron]QBQ74651.1 transcriptional regulator [Burkholderia phage BcepSauron]
MATNQVCGITNLPPVKPRTLRFRLNVTGGNRLVLKQLGEVDGIYGTDDMAAQSVGLSPGSSITLKKVTAFCLGTSAPVQVTLGISTLMTTINVNKVLVIDDAYDTVTIQNPSTATESAFLSVYYAQNSA